MRAERLPGGRFRIIAEAPVDTGDPDAPTEARVAHMARGLSDVYGRWIREHPDQWMCMARRWPKALELEHVARAEARGRGAGA
jgi:KDO2-lipid IV(A) lauroyltransferase